MKAAIILVVLMIGIIASNLLERRINNRNDFTISSIFEDRLQPSTYLFEMRTLNEQRLFILEEYLHADDESDKQRLNVKMHANHQAFDNLLLKYKKTFLVEEEQKLLAVLSENLKNFDSCYNLLKSGNTEQQPIVNAKVSIMHMNDNMGKLNTLQSEIGKDLLEDYKSDTYYSGFLNAFQILLAIVIGFIILTMVANARLLNKIDQHQKINLN